MILGIDPGTFCGWALLDDAGHRIASGVWDLSTRKHEGAGMRYLQLRANLANCRSAATDACEEPFRALAYEQVERHTGTDAAHIYGGVVATVQAWAEQHRLPYRGIPVGTVKRTATGNGAAAKVLMVDAANQRWHLDLAKDTAMRKKKGSLMATEEWTFPGGSDNEADALWIAEALRRELAT